MVRGKMKMAVGDWRSINTFSPSHVSHLSGGEPQGVFAPFSKLLVGVAESGRMQHSHDDSHDVNIMGKTASGKVRGGAGLSHLSISPYCRDCQPAGHRGKQ